jgi:hypothetical protein
MRMTLGKAMGIGFTVAVVLTAVAIAFSFVQGADANIPGVLEIDSTTVNGKPNTEFFFNPLVPIGLALLIGLVLWLPARLRGGRDR